MNGLVAYDSSDSETEEQEKFEGHLGHLKKQTQQIKSPPKRKPSTGSISSPIQTKPLGTEFILYLFLLFNFILYLILFFI